MSSARPVVSRFPTLPNMTAIKKPLSRPAWNPFKSKEKKFSFPFLQFLPNHPLFQDDEKQFYWVISRKGRWPNPKEYKSTLLPCDVTSAMERYIMAFVHKNDAMTVAQIQGLYRLAFKM